MLLRQLRRDLKDLTDELGLRAKMYAGRREHLESKDDDTGHCQQHCDGQDTEDSDPRAPALPASAMARSPAGRYLLRMTPSCYLRGINSGCRRVVILGAKRV